ncbi:MAG: hypothetical protein DMG03_07020, partial [Acidobacteria bacterium]
MPTPPSRCSHENAASRTRNRRCRRRCCSAASRLKTRQSPGRAAWPATGSSSKPRQTVATGSTPREIPQLPVGAPRTYYLRTEADARVLKAALAGCRDLLVVGGGLIGLEVASSGAMLGGKVPVLEVAPRILARVCDEQIGGAVHEAHARHGVDIRVGTTLLTATAQRDGRIAAVTGAGERFVADIVVVGTGSKPDDALAASAGLATDDGIVVDAQCRTSDRAILAAGDCVRFPGPQGLVRLENWLHAQDPGAIAGRNAAGANERYT